MAIGLGTALAIGAIASTGGSAAKGIIQSKAAKKAGQQQLRGTQDASRYMQQGLGQLGQLYSPYINSGAGAIGTLGRLTTPGAGARFASPGPPNAMPQPPTGNMAVPRGAMGSYGGGMGGGRQPAGPYYMAAGGDMVVDRPTMFIAGEAGPERATFSGAPGMGGPIPRPMMGPEAGMPMPRPMMPVRGQMPPEAAHGMPFTGAAGVGDIKAAMLAKYGVGSQRGGSQRGLAQRPPMPNPANLGAAFGAMRPPQLGPGGTFAQMAGGGGPMMRPPMPRPMPPMGPAGPGSPAVRY